MVKNNLKTLIRIFLYAVSNLAVLLVGLVIRRDKRIVLFGAWMGEKYADNSRFLFQYLAQNKEKYNLKRVIWVTRNHEVNQYLKERGFESYVIGTRESNHWHLKSGIHIMCNMAAKSGNHKPDIDVKLSTGADKVQLWHGVGIKAIGAKSNTSKSGNKNQRSNWMANFANLKAIRRIGFLGGWGEPKLLCTSELNKQINIGNSKIHPENVFISAYPRYCDCTFLLDKEKEVIQTISKYKISVLYLPTFRDEKSNYTHPTDDAVFLDYLKERGILWIQKPHQAEINKDSFTGDECVLNLEANFDVNSILHSVNIIISDYSSAAFDAIYLNKPVIMYVPDLDEYMNGPNGLLMDLRDLCPALLAMSQNELIQMIDEVLYNTYFSDLRNETFNRLRTEFFSNKTADYSLIWQDITKAIS